MSLKDKASRIKFPTPAVLPTSSPPVDVKTKTAPGAMMAFANDRRSEMLKENEELRTAAAEAAKVQARLDETLAELKQWEGAKGVRMIDPNLIGKSRFANRHDVNFDGEAFAQLKDEIANAGGNVQPIKVRPVQAEGQEKFEIVYGHRRHEACRQLGLPVAALVDNLDDQALFVEMDRENRMRENLSPWEQGVMYQRALDDGLFPSNKKLADAVGADLGNVGKALSLAALPVEVVDAFQSPLDIQYRFSKPLKDALAKDSQGVLKRAKVLSRHAHQLSGTEVLTQLLHGAGEGGLYGTTPSLPTQTSIEVDNKTAALVTHDGRGRLAIRFETKMDQAKTDQLLELVRKFLAG